MAGEFRLDQLRVGCPLILAPGHAGSALFAGMTIPGDPSHTRSDFPITAPLLPGAAVRTLIRGRRSPAWAAHHRTSPMRTVAPQCVAVTSMNSHFSILESDGFGK